MQHDFHSRVYTLDYAKDTLSKLKKLTYKRAFLHYLITKNTEKDEMTEIREFTEADIRELESYPKLSKTDKIGSLAYQMWDCHSIMHDQ